MRRVNSTNGSLPKQNRMLSKAENRLVSPDGEDFHEYTFSKGLTLSDCVNDSIADRCSAELGKVLEIHRFCGGGGWAIIIAS